MSTSESLQRQRCLSVLSQTNVDALNEVWQNIGPDNNYNWIRPAETGAVMVQGRAGGTGAPFNMGEMTVTRASVKLSDGTVGHGYVAGRNHRQAELIALLDAELQRSPELAEPIMAKLRHNLAETKKSSGRKAAATKVDFFTLVRGENPK